MTLQELDQPDRAVEAILRASRPLPDPAWQRSLERRLLGEPAPPPRRRFALRAGLALAAGLAALIVVLSLAGLGPLGGRSSEVDAHDDCRVVALTRIDAVPVLVHDERGATRLAYRKRPVTHHVTQCSRSARPPRADDATRAR